MHFCTAPLRRFYYPETRRFINAFIIIIHITERRLLFCVMYNVASPKGNIMALSLGML